MRKIIAAALVALLLAGCSGGGDPSSPSGGGATASSTLTSTGPPPKPVVYSDTLHLLAPPDMAAALPPGSDEVTTGTATFQGPGGGGGGQEPEAQWSYRVTNYSNVTTAEVHVWVEIRDTLVQPLDPRDPQNACTWIVTLELGADGEPEMGCLGEPPGPINAGTRELIFELLGLDAELELNETVTFTFNRRAFSASPDDSVFVLSGSETHDSRIVLKGLQEAVPE